jgi:hypothetical protein
MTKQNPNKPGPGPAQIPAGPGEGSRIGETGGRRKAGRVNWGQLGLWAFIAGAFALGVLAVCQLWARLSNRAP